MSTSIYLEIGEREYEVTYKHFQAAQVARGWDPGSGGEVELAPFVEVHGAASGSEVVTLDTFILMYAAEIGETLAKTEDMLSDRLYEALCDVDGPEYFDDDEDRRPDTDMWEDR